MTLFTPNTSRAIKIEIDGKVYNEWEDATVTRDLKEFAGTFSFNFRDTQRSLKTFDFATDIPPIFQLRPGADVRIFIYDELVFVGFIETVCPSIDENEASVSISGKDKAGDLVDGAAADEGPVEFKNVKLEDAAERIAKPYGITVRSEIDTGDVFERYSIDLTETGLSALEKGARQRQALLLSDGVGGLVITRTGANRAPDDLTLPGNVKSSNGTFTHKGRFSKTVVRGQSEKAAGKRNKKSKGQLDGEAQPLSASTRSIPTTTNSLGAAFGATGQSRPLNERQAGTGAATLREAEGVTATGIAHDEEIKRHKPCVHLARTKGNKKDCQCEADWRSRSSRGKSEEMSYVVAGFKANERLWRVNEMTYVSDQYQIIERDMLISKVIFTENDEGRITELTITSPEAFDAEAVKDRRKNKKGKKKTAKKKGSKGALDGTANAL